MAAMPQIAMVGPGRLGNALAAALSRAGYRIREVVSREGAASRRRARELARAVGARAVTSRKARLDADVIWFCVPDREIAGAARLLASATSWKGKIALHSSGVLASDELEALRRRGASVASVHPLMTFVRGSQPSLAGIPFALEGEAAAVRVARRMVRDLKGEPFAIARDRKSAYHAWGAFTSPLLVATLVTAERVARAAGLPPKVARRRMLPIVAQTVANYAALGPAGAFSGPMVRGDAATVREHVRVLSRLPEARKVYLALARAALRDLPVRKRKELEKALRG